MRLARTGRRELSQCHGAAQTPGIPGTRGPGHVPLCCAVHILCCAGPYTSGWFYFCTNGFLDDELDDKHA